MLNFSIRAMLFGIAYLMAGLICLLSLNEELRSAAILPGMAGNLSAGLVAAASIIVCTHSDWKSAWPLVAIGWLIACVEINVSVYNSFFIISGAPLEELDVIYQQGFNASVVSGIALPLFFTLPMLYPLICGRRNQFDPKSLLMLLPLSLAVGDTLLVWLLASYTFGTLGDPIGG